jgi:hypothetical protein
MKRKIHNGCRFLFKMGRENTFIKEFLNAIPREEGKDILPAGTVRFEDLF